MHNLITVEAIAVKILLIRGKRVMLDRDLAKLYEVETRELNQAVKRNMPRFPEDFMFQLTEQEAKSMVSQNVIPSTRSLGGHLPYAFTEQGVAMLSSVLNSERAILVNIQIMRTFVQLKRLVLTKNDLRRKIEEIEKKYDKQFAIVFQVIKQLLGPSSEKKRMISGFQTKNS
ncbi:MAG: ORF6N domain-containing protein [Candidatus Omnitrophota bacterium]